MYIPSDLFENLDEYIDDSLLGKWKGFPVPKEKIEMILKSIEIDTELSRRNKL